MYMYIFARKEAVVFVIAGIAGFLGASASRLVPQAVHAANADVLRASRIELIDELQKTRAVLETSARKDTHLVILARDGSNAMELGVDTAGKAYLNFNTDGSQRLSMRVGGHGNPWLSMGDSGSTSRLVLGAVQPDFLDPQSNTWALEFRAPRRDRLLAGINMSSWGGDHGSAFVVDSAGRLWPLGPKGTGK